MTLNRTFWWILVRQSIGPCGNIPHCRTVSIHACLFRRYDRCSLVVLPRRNSCSDRRSRFKCAELFRSVRCELVRCPSCKNTHTHTDAYAIVSLVLLLLNIYFTWQHSCAFAMLYVLYMQYTNIMLKGIIITPLHG